jgi:uncharacterized membrane protein YGL010W
MAIVLNKEWTALMESYRADHQDPRNQLCHSIGIPMIAASIPVGATILGIPLAAGLFSVGWTFQFVGHAFEGKKPSFVEDKRALAVGFMWWTQKLGLDLFRTPDEDAQRRGIAPANRAEQQRPVASA